MTTRGTLDALVVPVSEAVRAVGDILAVDDGAELLANLGYKVPNGGDLPTFFATLVNGAENLAQKLGVVLDAYADGSYEQPTFIPKVIELGIAVKDVVVVVEQLPGRANAAFAAAPDFVANAGLDRLPRRLIDYLVVQYLRREHPAIASFLELVGLSAQSFVPEGDYNPDFHLIEVRWDRLSLLVTNPGELFTREYAWGTAELAVDLLLDRLEGFFWLIGIQATVRAEFELEAPLFTAAVETPANGLATAEAGVRLRRADAPAADPRDVGLALVPYAQGEVGIETDLGAGWKVTADAELAAEGLSLGIRPHSGVELDATTAAAGSLGVGLVRDGEPLILFGNAGGTRMEIERIAVRLQAAVNASGPDAGFEIALDDMALILIASEGDGFLQAVLPKEPLTTSFDLTVGASLQRGMYFAGGAGLNYTIQINRSIGPIFIGELEIELTVDGPKATLSVGVTGGLEIGPIAAAIQGIGIELRSAFGQRGNLGNVDLSIGFKAPTGVALSVDAGPVTGGGFLFFDSAKEQYAGGLYLKLEIITLKAIGLLTTRLPDGSRGFSLLVIIQASGFTPIQLGWGFTLNGIGGLLGIHRTVNVDVLREGVRNRTLDAILFSPDDPTPRAPQIISTLQSVFPPAADQYVFGPMALFGWGVPVTLITIEIALILELPSPLRLIILGRVRAALPNAKQPIVSINCDVVGIIDFDRRELSVDASLYDSMVGPYALSGDMATRASWGENPDFAMALGGFHPAFHPPPGFPVLRRLALALSTGNNPRLRMEAYFALTSNTVQVGARLELYVEIAGFALDGDLGFDTLIQLSPFRILATIYAHLALKRGRKTLMSLDITVHLRGPAPWVLWGEAKFKVLFASYSRSFRETFGRKEDVPAIERTKVWDVLKPSLEAVDNWSAQLPESGQLVTVRAELSDSEPLAHPFGTLTVSQNLVPLERTLELFGSVPPADYNRFEIESAVGLKKTDKTTQHFAPAQFRRMSDAEKLSSPSFEPMVSGVHLVPQTAIKHGNTQVMPLDYEQVVILDLEEPPPAQADNRAIYTPAPARVAVLAEYGPAGTAEVRKQGRKKFAPPTPGPAVKDPVFVVATKDGLTKVTEIDGSDGSYTSAAEILRNHPKRDEWQIVRAEELSKTTQLELEPT